MWNFFTSVFFQNGISNNLSQFFVFFDNCALVQREHSTQHNSLSAEVTWIQSGAEGSQKVHFLFAGLTSTSRTEDYYTDNGKAPRHCGKTAPKDFGETVTSNAAALRLVFHSNQDDSCKGFAFQYRVETSKFCFVGAHGIPDFSL